MHLLAERTMVKHAIKIGLLNATEDDIMTMQDERVGAIFFPHGLGHFMGLQVHDVNGYSDVSPQRSIQAGLKSLRTRRTLQKGMILTIEPGWYFIDYILQNSYKDPILGKWLNKEKIEEYQHVGGVRVEEDIAVTDDGVE